MISSVLITNTVLSDLFADVNTFLNDTMFEPKDAAITFDEDDKKWEIVLNG
jgi:hypothetical protein